jgi:hypothetical protein
VTESLILQKTTVVPATPEPVNVVDAEDDVFIVQLVPVICQLYVNEPLLLAADAVNDEVVAFPTADKLVALMVGCNDDITIPKNDDI